MPLTPTLSPQAGRGRRDQFPRPAFSGEREGPAKREVRGREERDGEDPDRRGQRDEPGHAVAPADPPGLSDRHGGRRRRGHRDGENREPGPRADGYEPTGHRRLGGDAKAESRAFDPRNPSHWPYRTRNGG